MTRVRRSSEFPNSIEVNMNGLFVRFVPSNRRCPKCPGARLYNRKYGSINYWYCADMAHDDFVTT